MLDRLQGRQHFSQLSDHIPPGVGGPPLPQIPLRTLPIPTEAPPPVMVPAPRVVRIAPPQRPLRTRRRPPPRLHVESHEDVIEIPIMVKSSRYSSKPNANARSASISSRS